MVRKIAAAGCVAAIILAAYFRKSDPFIGTLTLPEDTLHCCNFIRSKGFSGNKTLQKDLVYSGGVKCAFEGLKRPASDAGTLYACTNAICAMAIFNAETSTAITDAGGIEAMMRVGKLLPQDGNIQGIVAGTLGCVSDEVPANRVKIVEHGALELVMKAWDAHPGNPETLFGACAAMAAMGFDNIPNKKAILDAGFLPRGLRAMENHPEPEKRVREEVLQVLQSLAGRPATAEIQEVLYKAGTFDPALKALREDPRIETQTNGIRFLAQMVQLNFDYAKELVEKGAIPLMVKHLQAGSGQHAWADNVWGTQGPALWALKSLVKKYPACKDEMMQADVPAKTKALLAARASDGFVQYMGKELLRELGVA